MILPMFPGIEDAEDAYTLLADAEEPLVGGAGVIAEGGANSSISE